jgi:hypothetical protein
LEFSAHHCYFEIPESIGMLLRFFFAVLAMAALVGSVDFAKAQFDNERQIMLGGGAPRANNYNFFGFSAWIVNRAASACYRPGVRPLCSRSRRGPRFRRSSKISPENPDRRPPSTSS